MLEVENNLDKSGVRVSLISYNDYGFPFTSSY